MPHAAPDPDERFPALDDALAWTWAALADGVASSKHNYHTGVLATVDDAGRPAARVVVLRRVDEAGRALICHSDARAPKVAQLRDRPHAAWLLWDPSAKVQLRLSGACTVHADDDLADRQWDAATATSRRCYLAPRAPSSPADGPSPNLPEDVRGEAPGEDRVRPGRGHFVVLRTVVSSIDWLYLHHAGHRRARFSWDEGGTPSSTWLEP